MNINELDNKYKELIAKPFKSQEELKNKEELRILLNIALDNEIRDLVNELNSIGLNINSVWDLLSKSQKYPAAIPILLKHLVKNYSDKNKEGIVRALAVKEAKGKATQILLDEYNKMPKEKMSLRWAIGNTIYTIITDDALERIFQIVEQKENGTSRQMFVAALGKVKSAKAEDILIKLLDDDEVIPQALEALGRMKSQKAKEKILELSNHQNKLKLFSIF